MLVDDEPPLRRRSPRSHRCALERTLVATRSVQGGEIRRGTYLATEPGPRTFELLLGGVPYGDPLLVP